MDNTEKSGLKNKNNVPKCIGIIMDGNRRWAGERGLPTFEGHRRGYKKLKDVILWAKESGVENVIVYAFSTENWQRTKKEIAYLLNLFRVMTRDMLAHARKEKVRVLFLGQIERFPQNIQTGIRNIEESTRFFSEQKLGIALSYGGRAEILSAIQKIIRENRGKITEKDFSQLLWTRDFPDPDMIIRTGGEMRLSNFLPWQSVYSELFFTKTYWPHLKKKEFRALLDEFSRRQKRHGK